MGHHRRNLLALLVAALLGAPAPAEAGSVPPFPLRPLNQDPGGVFHPNAQLLALTCASSVGFVHEIGCSPVPPAYDPADLLALARQQLGEAPSVLDRIMQPCGLRPGARGPLVLLPGARGPGTPGQTCDPTTFRSEMAALSWNLLMTLVAGSGGPDGFDPNDPMRLDGCSFRNPGACSAVQQTLGVPEPSTGLTFALGLALLGLGARRR